MSTKPKTLPAFTPAQVVQVHLRLATTVALMMGRKFEEDDWGRIYCEVKNIPRKGWSNLSIDVMHEGLAVEHKMLGRPSDSVMKNWCGTRLMHPAATRSIRIPQGIDDAEAVMKSVLTQYAELIESRKTKVAENANGNPVDMRTGWLLWQPSLYEFLYFEEEMLPPNPDDYTAEWRDSGGGSRKTSKNLWIYEKETGQKRYSITTAAGAKIQPYFDVPPPTDPNVYIFRVQGEELEPGRIRIWLSPSTARELAAIVGSTSYDALSKLISDCAENAKETQCAASLHPSENAQPMIISSTAYAMLREAFPGVSDEHAMQLLVATIRSK